jgi:hypothetical protein
LELVAKSAETVGVPISYGVKANIPVKLRHETQAGDAVAQDIGGPDGELDLDLDGGDGGRWPLARTSDKPMPC